MNARSGYGTQVVLGPNKVCAFLNGLLFGDIMKNSIEKPAPETDPWHFIIELEEAIAAHVAIADMAIYRISMDQAENNPEVSCGIVTLEMNARKNLLAAFNGLCAATPKPNR
jgi:hypothetical protein